MIRTSSDLLDSVKRAYFMPTSQNTFSDTDLLALGDDEISSYIIPRLITPASGYNMYSLQYTTDANNKIRVPTRAVGSTISYVRMLEQNGVSTDDYDWLYIPGGDLVPDGARLSNNYHYAIYNSYLRITPTPDTGRTIEIGYMARGGQLVLPTNTTYVTTVATIGSTTFTVASGSTIAASTTKFDIIKATPNYEYIAMDYTSSTTGTTITPSGGVPAQLEVGDYVVRQGYSPVAQLPQEWQPYLALCIALRCASAVQDSSGIADITARIQGIERALINTVQPRFQGAQTFNAPQRRFLI